LRKQAEEERRRRGKVKGNEAEDGNNIDGREREPLHDGSSQTNKLLVVDLELVRRKGDGTTSERERRMKRATNTHTNEAKTNLVVFEGENHQGEAVDAVWVNSERKNNNKREGKET
jgi:hypothetical protein